MNYRLRQLLALAKEHVVVTVCLITILVAGNVSLYLNGKNTELEIKQARLRNEGEAANLTKNAATSLRNDAALIESALKEIDASLVTEDNLAENIGYFYIIEDQTHAHIGELRQNTATPAAPGESEGKYKTVPVSLTVKGSYAQAFEFLHKVETGSRLIKISSFTIHRSQPTGDMVTLALELNMLAYP
jgi:Tfp pilus assembly protein PilO